MKTNDKEMVRNLQVLKKKAIQGLLTPKSRFDFVKNTQKAETGRRKTLRVKSITRSQCD